jgi:hypothetical protein
MSDRGWSAAWMDHSRAEVGAGSAAQPGQPEAAQTIARLGRFTRERPARVVHTPAATALSRTRSTGRRPPQLPTSINADSTTSRASRVAPSSLSAVSGQMDQSPSDGCRRSLCGPCQTPMINCELCDLPVQCLDAHRSTGYRTSRRLREEPSGQGGAGAEQVRPTRDGWRKALVLRAAEHPSSKQQMAKRRPPWA